MTDNNTQKNPVMFGELRPLEGSSYEVNVTCGKADPLNGEEYREKAKPMIMSTITLPNDRNNGPTVKVLTPSGNVLYHGLLFDEDGNNCTLCDQIEPVADTWSEHLGFRHRGLLLDALECYKEMCDKVLRLDAILGPEVATVSVASKTRMIAAMSGRPTIISGHDDGGNEHRAFVPKEVTGEEPGAATRKVNGVQMPVIAADGEEFVEMRMMVAKNAIAPVPGGMAQSDTGLIFGVGDNDTPTFHELSDKDKHLIASMGIPDGEVIGCYVFRNIAMNVSKAGDDGLLFAVGRDVPVFIRSKDAVSPLPGFCVPAQMWSAVNDDRAPVELVSRRDAEHRNAKTSATLVAILDGNAGSGSATMN